MRLIISFVVILAPHAFAIEPAKGQLNGLDRRQTADYCGTDSKPNYFLPKVNHLPFITRAPTYNSPAPAK